MTQLQLSYDYPLSRTSDPDTSKRAAVEARKFTARHISIIWNCLRDNGPMTPREISARTGMDYVAVQRRGAEMAERRLITRGPEVKDGQRVWCVK